MNKIIQTFVTMATCSYRAVLHPRTRLSSYHCGVCGAPLAKFEDCPECGADTLHSPRAESVSPIPWWGSVATLVVGGVFIGISYASSQEIMEFREIGKFLAYWSVGNITGMSIRMNNRSK